MRVGSLHGLLQPVDDVIMLGASIRSCPIAAATWRHCGKAKPSIRDSSRHTFSPGKLPSAPDGMQKPPLSKLAASRLKTQHEQPINSVSTAF